MEVCGSIPATDGKFAVGFIIFDSSLKGIEDTVVTVENDMRSLRVVRITGATVIGAQMNIAAVARDERQDKSQ